VALGSNLGRPLQRLRAAERRLRGCGRVVARSSIYRTNPVGGPSGQPTYLNAVVALEPDEGFGNPHDLLATLLEIERAEGRVRRERWGPRRLDLDLLAVGDAVIEGPGLTLPHPRMMERAFVLAPLCEAAPTWRHPASGVGACEALRALPTGGFHRTPLSWGAG
jgi:2-amino-4-hydroxy-6-hydroxymethyldihydropteridine diphosphokinase